MTSLNTYETPHLRQLQCQTRVTWLPSTLSSTLYVKYCLSPSLQLSDCFSTGMKQKRPMSAKP